MAVFFWRFRPYWVLGFCVLASTAFLVMGESGRMASARRFRAAVFLPLEKGLRAGDGYVDLQRGNEQLRLRVTELTAANARLEDAQEENETLRRILGFRELGHEGMVAAEVIGWDRTSVGLNLEIDRGADSGVGVGHAVVSVEGLVGRVFEVYGRSSWVVTIRSPDCPVSALDLRSRVRGIVRWHYPDGLTFDLVSAQSDVREEDLVTTSGLGGTFPKGLRVGVVESVEARAGELFPTIRLRETAALDRVEHVVVLTGDIGGEWEPTPDDARPQGNVADTAAAGPGARTRAEAP